MDPVFTSIDVLLVRIERLATDLRADPDGHVRRSTNELREIFAARGEVEPAVERVRHIVAMLRRGNQEGARREFQRRAHGVDYLQDIVERELLPALRRVGFEV